MKFVYPAVFRQKDDGTYEGRVPDLEGCVCRGDSLEDAVDAANEAVSAWLELELSEEEPDLPSISDPADLGAREGEVVRNICVTIRFHTGWDE